MRSKVASDIATKRLQRLAAMTPAERVRLAERLGVDGIATYMTTHGVDRQTAIRQIHATRRLGRRPSRSAADDD